MKKKVFYCSVNGWDCPYWQENGRCAIDGDPLEECEDFATFWDPDDEYWIEVEEND